MISKRRTSALVLGAFTLVVSIVLTAVDVWRAGWGGLYPGALGALAGWTLIWLVLHGDEGNRYAQELLKANDDDLQDDVHGAA